MDTQLEEEQAVLQTSKGQEIETPVCNHIELVGKKNKKVINRSVAKRALKRVHVCGSTARTVNPNQRNLSSFVNLLELCVVALFEVCAQRCRCISERMLCISILHSQLCAKRGGLAVALEQSSSAQG